MSCFESLKSLIYIHIRPTLSFFGGWGMAWRLNKKPCHQRERKEKSSFLPRYIIVVEGRATWLPPRCCRAAPTFQLPRLLRLLVDEERSVGITAQLPSVLAAVAGDDRQRVPCAVLLLHVIRFALTCHQ